MNGVSISYNDISSYINPFPTDNTIICRFESATNIAMCIYYRRNVSLRFCRNSEANGVYLACNFLYFPYYFISKIERPAIYVINISTSIV